MSSIDAALKPRIRLRTPGEYTGWVLSILAGIGILVSVLTNPNFKWGTVAQYFTHESILRGLMLTIFLTLASMALGTLLGLGLAIMRSSHVKPVSIAANIYITLFRGTPVLVQLIFWFNFAALYPNLTIGIPFTDIGTAIDMNALMAPITAALVGLTLNEGAYMAEIVRAGILSVDEGQGEAAHALGMVPSLTMRRIVLPQAMRVIIPPTGNEFISMLKTTSLASVVIYGELLRRSRDIYSANFETLELLLVASLWYLAITSVATAGQYYIERRFARGSMRDLPPTPLQRMRRLVGWTPTAR